MSQTSRFLRRSPVVLLIPIGIMLGGTVCYADLQAQAPPSPQSIIRAASTAALPHGEVAGVVYDAGTGSALKGVVIWFEGTQHGAVSDDLGRFRFRAPVGGELRLKADYVGYTTARAVVVLEPDRGSVFEIGLQQAVVPMCGLVVCAGPYGCFAVEALVRDVLTGVAPAKRVTLRVIGTAAADSISVDPQASSGSVHVGAAAELIDRGPYKVEVAAPGYATWQRFDVRRDVCGRVSSRPFDVWLFPDR